MSTWVSAISLGLVGCHYCGQLHEIKQARNYCCRCGARLRTRKPNSLPRTRAYLLAAYMLYIPANILPIMLTTHMGSVQTDTIMSGVKYLMTEDSWPLALIIFIASIFVPALKLIILSALVVSVQICSSWKPWERARLYRLAELTGRWSMVDIYVVALMVALVNVQGLVVINAGIGAIAFGAVVVLTMLASMSFDPRLIWDCADKKS